MRITITMILIGALKGRISFGKTGNNPHPSVGVNPVAGANFNFKAYEKLHQISSRAAVACVPRRVACCRSRHSFSIIRRMAACAGGIHRSHSDVR